MEYLKGFIQNKSNNNKNNKKIEEMASENEFQNSQRYYALIIKTGNCLILSFWGRKRIGVFSISKTKKIPKLELQKDTDLHPHDSDDDFLSCSSDSSTQTNSSFSRQKTSKIIIFRQIVGLTEDVLNIFNQIQENDPLSFFSLHSIIDKVDPGDSHILNTFNCCFSDKFEYLLINLTFTPFILLSKSAILNLFDFADGIRAKNIILAVSLKESNYCK